MSLAIYLPVISTHSWIGGIVAKTWQSQPNAYTRLYPKQHTHTEAWGREHFLGYPLPLLYSAFWSLKQTCSRGCTCSLWIHVHAQKQRQLSVTFGCKNQSAVGRHATKKKLEICLAAAAGMLLLSSHPWRKRNSSPECESPVLCSGIDKLSRFRWLNSCRYPAGRAGWSLDIDRSVKIMIVCALVFERAQSTFSSCMFFSRFLSNASFFPDRSNTWFVGQMVEHAFVDCSWIDRSTQNMYM